MLVDRRQWIVGPIYDSIFFSTLWLLPLFVVMAAGFQRSNLGLGFFFLWIYHLLVRLPHFAATLKATYLRRDQWPYYLRHWFRFLAVPVLILAGYAALFHPATAGALDGVRPYVLAATYFWGYQHLTMQHYGILQLYHARSGAPPDPGRGRIEKVLLYAVLGTIVLNSQAAPFMGRIGLAVPPLWETWVEPAGWVVLAVLLAALLQREWRYGRLTVPVVLYLAVALAASCYWPFYENLPPGSWFLVFNGQHSVAYLGIVFLLDWNQRHPDRPFQWRPAMGSFLAFFGPLVAVSAAMLLFVHWAGPNPPLRTIQGNLHLMLGVFVVHYYLESMVWRFRTPHNRETTLPLLARPASVGGPAGRG